MCIQYFLHLWYYYTLRFSLRFRIFSLFLNSCALVYSERSTLKFMLKNFKTFGSMVFVKNVFNPRKHILLGNYCSKNFQIFYRQTLTYYGGPDRAIFLYSSFNFLKINNWNLRVSVKQIASIPFNLPLSELLLQLY